MSTSEAVPAPPVRRSLRSLWSLRRLRRLRHGATIAAILLPLYGVPWWTLFAAGARWPGPVTIMGTVLFAGGLVALPLLMVFGHGRPGLDRAAHAGDTLLGVIWVLFAWAVLANLARPAMAVVGIPDPARSRILAATVAAVSLLLVLWGYAEARRVPRIRRV